MAKSKNRAQENPAITRSGMRPDDGDRHSRRPFVGLWAPPLMVVVSYILGTVWGYSQSDEPLTPGDQIAGHNATLSLSVGIPGKGHLPPLASADEDTNVPQRDGETAEHQAFDLLREFDFSDDGTEAILNFPFTSIGLKDQDDNWADLLRDRHAKETQLSTVNDGPEVDPLRANRRSRWNQWWIHARRLRFASLTQASDNAALSYLIKAEQIANLGQKSLRQEILDAKATAHHRLSEQVIVFRVDCELRRAGIYREHGRLELASETVNQARTIVTGSSTLDACPSRPYVADLCLAAVEEQSSWILMDIEGFRKGDSRPESVACRSHFEKAIKHLDDATSGLKDALAKRSGQADGRATRLSEQAEREFFGYLAAWRLHLVHGESLALASQCKSECAKQLLTEVTDQLKKLRQETERSSLKKRITGQLSNTLERRGDLELFDTARFDCETSGNPDDAIQHYGKALNILTKDGRTGPVLQGIRIKTFLAKGITNPAPHESAAYLLPRVPSAAGGIPAQTVGENYVASLLAIAHHLQNKTPQSKHRLLRQVLDRLHASDASQRFGRDERRALLWAAKYFSLADHLPKKFLVVE